MAVQEASKLISESLAGSITIGDMRIDNKGNIQYKEWEKIKYLLPFFNLCYLYENHIIKI